MKHRDYSSTQTVDISTLSRILRTTRGLTPDEREKIRDKIRAEQARQGVPLTPHLAARLAAHQPR